MVPWATTASHMSDIEPLDTIPTITNKIQRFPTGGTDMSAPLRLLDTKGVEDLDLLIWITDEQSWMDTASYHRERIAGLWEKYRSKNRKAKAVFINLQAYETVQVVDDGNVLNIGGWSDAMFETISSFIKGDLETGNWVAKIKAIKIPS